MQNIAEISPNITNKTCKYQAFDFLYKFKHLKTFKVLLLSPISEVLTTKDQEINSLNNSILF